MGGGGGGGPHAREEGNLVKVDKLTCFSQRLFRSWYVCAVVTIELKEGDWKGPNAERDGGLCKCKKTGLYKERKCVCPT